MSACCADCAADWVASWATASANSVSRAATAPMIRDKADKGQRTVRLAELCSDAAPTAVELVVD